MYVSNEYHLRIFAKLLFLLQSDISSLSLKKGKPERKITKPRCTFTQVRHLSRVIVGVGMVTGWYCNMLK